MNQDQNRMKRILLFVISALCAPIQQVPLKPSTNTTSRRRARRHTSHQRNPLAELSQTQLSEFLGFMLAQDTNTIIISGEKSSTILTNDSRLKSHDYQPLSRAKRNRYYTPRFNRTLINQFSQKMHCVVFKRYNLPGCDRKK